MRLYLLLLYLYLILLSIIVPPYLARGPGDEFIHQPANDLFLSAVLIFILHLGDHSTRLPNIASNPTAPAQAGQQGRAGNLKLPGGSSSSAVHFFVSRRWNSQRTGTYM